ncbi:hypothetical protein SLEP1_g5135 [Rubroshorea leprosula]|uniref:NAB domain-containing protein n=1 Tax=Rubroshorea leprosula TaxID=152421 RepID=A0AAV5HWX5_9ROSI|nr:hypothetical protein SLEP1_g5135 [Rubroshorea leprosula]
MEKMDSMSESWRSHLSPDNSQWLEENREKMDQSVKQMLKLIEDHAESSPQMRSLYNLHLQEFYTIYQSLAQRYHHFTEELCKNLPQNCQLSTPESVKYKHHASPQQNMDAHKSDASLSSGGHTSGLSLKDAADSSSFLSDSDSESYGSSVILYLDSPMQNINHGDGVDQTQRIIHHLNHEQLQLDEAGNADGNGMLKEITNANDDKELPGAITKSKQGLRISPDQKCQLYEEEDVRLKSEFADEREVGPELENKLVLELRRQIADLESQLSASNSEISRLREELDVNRETLKLSDEQIAKLKQELGKKISDLNLADADVGMLKTQLDSERLQVMELTEKLARYSNDLSQRDCEIEGLEVGLCDAQENFLMVKEQLQSEIASLSEQHTLTCAKLNEWELRAKSLEEKIMQCEAEKMEMKHLRDAEENGLRGQINELKAEVGGRDGHIEALNKNLDTLKLKYDTVMTQKDEMNAKVNTLMAEVSWREKQIAEKEEHLGQLREEHLQLISMAESSGELADELKQRVGELEKEVEWQRSMILDGAEKKKEAIRQLCFSLEHYRSGYKQVCRAFLNLKQANAVMA